MADQKRCMRCMEEYDAGYEVCPHCGYKKSSAPKNPMHLTEGSILNDKYVLGEVLGHGGFGVTYVAFDIELDIKVAIKEFFPYGISTRTSDNPTVFPITAQDAENNYIYGKQKFIEEARTLAKFSKLDSIVNLYGYFEQNNTVYIVMEFLDGMDLLQYLNATGGKLSMEQTLGLIASVFDAVEAIHAIGMVHRDISPDNIFITKEGKTKLLDFGTARFAMGEKSRSLSVILKPGFAPPEQYSSKGKQGPWTDVYSLSATIYRCITGQTPADAVDRQLGEELILPNEIGASLAKGKERELLKGLSIKPEDRHQRISELKEVLFGTKTVLVPNIEETEDVIKRTVIVQEDGHESGIAADVAVEKARGYRIAAFVIAVVMFALCAANLVFYAFWGDQARWVWLSLGLVVLAMAAVSGSIMIRNKPKIGTAMFLVCTVLIAFVYGGGLYV